jgi:hypothetical protein
MTTVSARSMTRTVMIRWVSRRDGAVMWETSWGGGGGDRCYAGEEGSCRTDMAVRSSSSPSIRVPALAYFERR